MILPKHAAPLFALRFAAEWNASKAAECYKYLKKQKNNRIREELMRDARRYVQNEISIRQQIASRTNPVSYQMAA